MKKLILLLLASYAYAQIPASDINIGNGTHYLHCINGLNCTVNGVQIIMDGSLSGGFSAGTNYNFTGSDTFTQSLNLTATPPLVVSSSTNVPNLNASFLNGTTFASPAAIGTGNPNTGVFTNLTDSALTSGNCVQASAGGLLTTVSAPCGPTALLLSNNVFSGTNAFAAVKTINNTIYPDVTLTTAALQTAIASCSNALGCVVDASNPQLGNQTFTSNPFAGLNMPITLITGPYTISYDMGSFYVDHPSHFHWTMHGTIFQDSTTTNVVFPGALLNSRVYQTTGSITSGTKSLTVASATGFVVGGVVNIYGAGGGNANQQTTANNGASILAGDTGFTVTSTTGWGSEGSGPTWFPRSYLLIDTEILKCTTVSGNVFSNCTRGLFGTTAASHALNATVTAVGGFFSEITAISGTTITIADNATQTVTGATVATGVTDVTIDGDGTIAGNPSAVGGEALNYFDSSKVTVTTGIAIKNFAFGGIVSYASRYSTWGAGLYENVALDSDVWFFGSDADNTVLPGNHINCAKAVWMNDRSSLFEIYSGGANKNTAYIGSVENCNTGVAVNGLSSNNTIYTGMLKVTTNGVSIQASNWLSGTPQPQNNTFFIGAIDSAGTSIGYAQNLSGANSFYVGQILNGTMSTVPNGDSMRVGGNQGLVQSTVSLSAGWGTTASITSAPASNPGTSNSVSFTITSAGTGQAANPTFTMTTFSNGHVTAPCFATFNGGTGTAAFITNSTFSQSAPVFTYLGTPVAASTYIVSVHCGP